MPNKRKPIDPEVAEVMRDIGRNIDESLPKGWGFCLLTFQFGPEGNTNYIANALREDMIKVLEEFLEHVRSGEVHEAPPKKRH